MHMAMGHGDMDHGGMDHGDMDMGGQCSMNVRYSSKSRIYRSFTRANVEALNQ